MTKAPIKIVTAEDFLLAREHLDMSQEAAAEMFNVTHRTYRYWEERSPSALACRVMEWIINSGFRPPEYRKRTIYGRRSNKLTKGQAT